MSSYKVKLMSVHFTAGLLANPSTPLTHARIGWQNRIRANNFTATTAEVGYPATNIVNPGTYERYRPTTSPAVIVLDSGSPKISDYMAVQTKNLTNVQVEYSDDGISYTSLFNEATTDNTNMFLFNEVSARYWRVTLTGVSLQVVVLKIGLVLAMYRPKYGGVNPLPLARVTAVRPNLSETGQFLGASQKRIGVNGSIEWDNLPADWYRTNFDIFAQTNPRVQPFFIAWRPLTFSEDVNYAWATGDVSPSNSGTRDFMSVGLSMEGFIDAE